MTHLEIDQSKSMGEVVNQICGELQLVRDPVWGGEGLAALSDTDMVVFEQLVPKVGLENAGVRELVWVLKVTQIHLVPGEDHESNTSIMGTSHDSLPRGFQSDDPLGLNTGDHSDLEGGGEIIDHSHPSEPMDKSDKLGHGVQPTRGAVSDASMPTGGVSDLPSEDMDTTAQPSELESHSSFPSTSQDARSHRSGPVWLCVGGRRRRGIQASSIPQGITLCWHQGDYYMDPTEVAPSVGRVGRPNSDASNGGHKCHPLPPRREGRATPITNGS